MIGWNGAGLKGLRHKMVSSPCKLNMTTHTYSNVNAINHEKSSQKTIFNKRMLGLLEHSWRSGFRF